MSLGIWILALWRSPRRKIICWFCVLGSAKNVYNDKSFGYAAQHAISPPSQVIEFVDRTTKAPISEEEVEEILRTRGEDPIVIVMVDGGLCSAITKYILGECFRKHFGMVVKYDLTWFETNGKDSDNKGSRLFTLTTLFPHLEMEAASQEEIAFDKRYFKYKNPKPYWYEASLFDNPRPLYFDGYAENLKYLFEVKEKVFAGLRFKDLELNAANRDVLSEILEAPVSIAVHVRRGDYVRLGMAMLGVDYYRTAIERILSSSEKKKATAFFFSDDIDWVRNHLVPQLPTYIEWRCVDVNDIEAGHFDLFLISQCDHQVSSNSSFGYWGGLLNESSDKKVILPMRWLPGQTRGPELFGCDTAHDYPGFEKLENFPDV